MTTDESVTPEMLDAAMLAFGNTEIVGSSFTRRAVANAIRAALEVARARTASSTRKGL